MSFAAAAGLPLRAAPSARAKCVIASVACETATRAASARPLRSMRPLERVARRDRREGKEAGGRRARRCRRVQLDARADRADRIHRPSSPRRPARSAGRRRPGSRARAAPRRRVVLARGRRRCEVGLDRLLPVAHAREGVRRHVQRVRRGGRDLRVAARGVERAGRQRRRVVAVNDVVREPGMIGLPRELAARESPPPSTGWRRSCRSAAPSDRAPARRRSAPRDRR